LIRCIEEFNSRHDRESLPWAKQAAFDRGSFTSLLGVVINHEASQVHIFAIGDSIAILCDGSRLISSCPYENPSQFDDYPSLLGTILNQNSFDEEERIICTKETWNYSGMRRPILFSMTDALARWFLEAIEKGRKPSRLLSIVCREGSKGNFSQFVLNERASANLRKDDTTVLAFW
jgi:hypothetical protein